ncbi:AMP-binding protein [Flavobacterium sp. LM4]|uniref:AMP-binding protein n=1 Tax=Flavobacterium sp. LM4 TaxID=1938609 RepID=UPI00099330E8|nr:AMP-binding protein [Flavobacterium sp. LM4]OOV17734.1 AMP-dependent synthetase [Flavobacterium sp. LM4]
MSETKQLYELILGNKNLLYIDSVKDKANSVLDFHESLDIIGGGGLAFLYLDNQIQSVELLLNFIRSDFTIALLSPSLNVIHKEYLEKHYNPYYIYDATRIKIDAYSAKALGATHTCFVQDKAVKTVVNPSIKLLLSTSGSTGSPKFVKLSEQNIVSNALSILDYLPVKNFDVCPLNLPLFYSYGFSVFTTNSISGGTIVCSDTTIMQKEFWEEWERYQYTSLAGVPYVYEMLQRIGFLKKEYPSLRYLSQAGGRLNPSALIEFGNYALKNGLSFYTMYGQTEATARMSYLEPQYLIEKAGSIGKPIKDGKMEIDLVSGELLYSGPNVSGGYATVKEDLLEYSPLKVLHTGDIAKKDKDGFFYITGRSQRFIKLFGTRISLDEIEQILQNNFAGTKFLCLGEDDKILIVAYLYDDLNELEIKKILSEQVKLHPTTIKVKKINELPLSQNGKIDYKEVKEMVAF